MSVYESVNTEIELAEDVGMESAANWSAIFAMTLCAFALVSSEFMPVSLLTPMATSFGIGEGFIGQGISISGALAVITSLSIATLVGNINRRTLLLWLTALMLVSGTIIAFAPTYTIYMIGRAFIGIAIGGFWSLSVATAIRLVPSSEVPKALSIFNGGSALAMVIAAPMGSYLGDNIGWRGAFFAVVLVAVISFLWQWFSLPSMEKNQGKVVAKDMYRVISKKTNAYGFLGAGLFFMGQFCLFTYIRPFLEYGANISGSHLSFVLLLIGVMGFIGTIVIGSVIKLGLYRVLGVIPFGMAVIAALLVYTVDSQVSVTVLLGLWGLVATAAPVGWWAWLAKAMPEDSEIGGGLMVAIVQLSIGLGSTMGGLLFDTNSLQGTFCLAGAILLLSASIVLRLSKLK